MPSSDAASPAPCHYGDHRPYPDPPTHLSDLTEPTRGVIELPITIDCGPRQSYDMALDSDRRVVYEMVLQEAGSTAEVALYVNGAALTEVWPRLFLPQRVRDSGRLASRFSPRRTAVPETATRRTPAIDLASARPPLGRP